MASTQGSTVTYDEPIATGGNREDLSNILYDISPTETPFLTLAKKGSAATATAHDWLTDELDAPGDNAHVEGEDAAPVKAGTRVRLSNHTQILKKHAVVSGTQEKVLKGGGIKSEMAYQVARRMKEMKRDLERACVGVSNAKVAGSEAVAREMGSFDSYLVTGFQGGAGSAAPTGNGVDTPTAGTARAITEDIFKAALEALWDTSGGNENVTALCGAHVRGQISNFTSSATRNVTTDDRKLVASIDVYDGDFHTVTVQADRYSKKDSCFIIDPEYVSLSDMRAVSTHDLAKIGDSIRKEVVWETTLEVNNPDAHMNIADLLTS